MMRWSSAEMADWQCSIDSGVPLVSCAAICAKHRHLWHNVVLCWDTAEAALRCSHVWVGCACVYVAAFAQVDHQFVLQNSGLKIWAMYLPFTIHAYSRVVQPPRTARMGGYSKAL